MFKVKLQAKHGYDTAEYQAKIQKAISVFEKVVNSEEFKEEVLNYEFRGKKQFVDNLGLSNQQVYNKILAGAEYGTKADNKADLFLFLDKRQRNGIGYTYPGCNNIYTYEWFFKQAEVNEFAGHIAHEWCHNLGFDHDFRRTRKCKHSVPYAIGNIIVKLGE